MTTLIPPRWTLVLVLSLSLCAGAAAQSVVFSEHFDDNGAGWVLGSEWQIGAATASVGNSTACGNGDPGVDARGVPGGGVAGAVIGGNVSAQLHAPYWLTSPPVDTTQLANPGLSFARWLNSDHAPFAINHVECWNGSTWVSLWQSGPTPAVMDGAWTTFTHDLSAFSNSALRVRFGHEIGSVGAYTCSGWNLDDVVIADALPVTAAFGASTVGGGGPLTVHFTDLSTGPVVNRHWDFGDGTTSIQQDPTHTYTQPGLFTVTLTVSGFGFSDTRIETGYVTVTPGIDLQITGTNVGPDYHVTFQISNGTPGASHFTALAPFQTTFPAGWFYGIDIPVFDLIQQFVPGLAPFRGTLDASGEFDHTLILPGTSGPLGIVLTAVTVEIDAATGGFGSATLPILSYL